MNLEWTSEPTIERTWSAAVTDCRDAYIRIKQFKDSSGEGTYDVWFDDTEPVFIKSFLMLAEAQRLAELACVDVLRRFRQRQADLQARIERLDRERGKWRL